MTEISVPQARARGADGKSAGRRATSEIGHKIIALFALPCILASFGCAGGGKVQLLSLDYKSIDPPAPRVFDLALDHCVWWTDEGGRLWLALDRDMPSIFGPIGRVQFELSVRLEKLPSGRARNYSLSADEVRVRIRTGMSETRLTSVSGILAIYREGADTLRGTFRFQANRYSLQILGGWGRGAPFLFLGHFTAVPDRGRGAAIVKSTEESGFERGEPTSQPVKGAADLDQASP